jgi:hypothetical protein
MIDKRVVVNSCGWWALRWIGTRSRSLRAQPDPRTDHLTQVSVYLRPHSPIIRSTRDYDEDEPGE